MEQTGQITLKKPQPRSEKQRELLRTLNEELTRCYLNSGQAYDENRVYLFYDSFAGSNPEAVRQAFECFRRVSRFVPTISDIQERISSVGYAQPAELGKIVREWSEEGICWREYDKAPGQRFFVRRERPSPSRDARHVAESDRKSQSSR